MEQKQVIKSVTFILAGALLQLFNGVDSGWASVFVSIGGFALYFSGLRKLKPAMDHSGQNAVHLLSVAAIIGFLGSIIDLIPLMFIFTGIIYVVAFGLQFFGFLRLNSSETIGFIGKRGVSLLLIAMILAVIQAFAGMFSFIGAYFASPFAIAALFCMLFGWTKIQEGLIENATKIKEDLAE
jgi:hypothetical protein